MKFFTILAIALCCGTIFVCADYYVEFRAPSTTGASSSSARAQPTMADFMYECEGIPAGRTALTADESLCKPITSPGQKVTIHATCTFFSVFGANLGGHVIHLSDRGIMPSNLVWMLGYRNDAIDHPNFAESSFETVAFLQARVEEMRMNNAVPSNMVPALAQYFAQTNVIFLSRSPVIARQLLGTFASFLNRVVDKNGSINPERNPARAESLRSQITLAIQVSLQKMIDPCSALPRNLQLASRYCAVHCKFLGVVTGIYGSGSNRRSTMLGGHCQGVVCNCFDIIRNPLAGCHYSRMHDRNNALRMNLLDYWTGSTK